MNGFRKMLIIVFAVFAVSAVSYCKINFVEAQCNTINGTIFGDVLTGTPQCDIINGRAGDDVISGNCGADDMRGGPGFDTIFFNVSDGDMCKPGLGGGNCICPDTSCAGGTCKYDFRIKDDILPASTGKFSEVVGDPETIDVVAFGCPNKASSLKGLQPDTIVTKHFAAKGFSETTGLPGIPSADNLALAYGNYAVKQDPDNEGVLIVEVPAYTKEESSMAASELFIPDGDSYIMFDHNSSVEIILRDMDYIRFNGTALIPVQ